MRRKKKHHFFIYLTTSYITNKTAHGIQILNMSSAFFSELGDNFRLISFGKNEKELKFQHRFYNYKLPKFVRTIFLLYILLINYDKRSSFIYTRDIVLSFLLLILGFHVCYECHSLPSNYISNSCFKLSTRFTKFKSVYISSSLFQEIYRTHFFRSLQKRTSIQHDGVNINDYQGLNKIFYKEKYRKELKLDREFLLVHTGSLYKGGSQIFKNIVESIDNIFLFHVGGSPEEVKRLSWELKNSGRKNFKLIPRLDQETVRGIQMSADLLLHINSKKSNIHWCTSPLKIFEYMTTKNPIIFARSQSVDEILNNENAYPYIMDDSSGCIKSIKLAISDISKKNNKKADLAYQEVINNFTWEIRAQKIIKFLKIF